MPPVPDTYQPSDTKPPSRHLRAADFKLDTQWQLAISDVTIEEMPSRDQGGEPRNRLILAFKGKQKGLVLNGTNQKFLELRLGFQPNLWIGHEIVLLVTTTQFGHDTVPAFRIIKVISRDLPEQDADEEAPF